MSFVSGAPASCCTGTSSAASGVLPESSEPQAGSHAAVMRRIVIRTHVDLARGNLPSPRSGPRSFAGTVNFHPGMPRALWTCMSLRNVAPFAFVEILRFVPSPVCAPRDTPRSLDGHARESHLLAATYTEPPVIMPQPTAVAETASPAQGVRRRARGDAAANRKHPPSARRAGNLPPRTVPARPRYPPETGTGAWRSATSTSVAATRTAPSSGSAAAAASAAATRARRSRRSTEPS